MSCFSSRPRVSSLNRHHPGIKIVTILIRKHWKITKQLKTHYFLMKLIEIFFSILNASLESRFEPSYSFRQFSVFPFQMTIVNIWIASCIVFSNVQKNFTCRVNLTSMCTNIFIRYLVKVGIETRKLDLRNCSWLYYSQKTISRTSKSRVLMNTIITYYIFFVFSWKKNHGCVLRHVFNNNRPN